MTEYTFSVIKSFADRRTQELYITGKARRFPPDILRRAIRKLDYVNLATKLDDKWVPPGNRLHALRGDLEGQYAIAINDQWRIFFALLTLMRMMWRLVTIIKKGVKYEHSKHNQDET